MMSHISQKASFSNSRAKRQASFLSYGPIAGVLLGMTCVALFQIFVVVENGEALPRGRPGHRHDLICGPRCVKGIIDYYYPEQTIDLIEIVSEMQFPNNMESGSSLQDIATVLHSRGIYAYPVLLSDHSQLNWRHPVVLHLTKESDSLGHFAIWLPSRWMSEDLKLRLSESLCDFYNEVPQNCSGAILLTAPSQILSSEIAFEPVSSNGRFFWFAGAAIFAIPIVVGLMRHLRG